MMLNNMFNIFDPMLFNIPMNYLIMMFMILLSIKLNYWMLNLNLFNKINLMFNKDMTLNNPFMNKSLLNLFNSLINLMLMMNLINLIPNLFYISSNIMFTINMSFFFILNSFLFNLNNNWNIFLMNLTPKNTPIYLIPLINLIEMNSFFIQILTLALRLMINMMLGHIIMILINNKFIIFIYIIIELMIIIIQSYVFFILNLLNSNNMY